MYGPIHFFGWLAMALALIVNASGTVPVAARDGGPNPAVALPSTQLGTGFTYQGQLNNAGSPVNANCDFQFGLYNAFSGPAQVGATQTVSNVGVVGGKFTVLLNGGNEFGSSAFLGEARWLNVAVRCPAGAGSYTNLVPRQSMTAAPYALSLMPGAVISATSGTSAGAALVVRGVSPYDGVSASSNSGSGVFGYSRNGYGVIGSSDSTSGTAAGVRAWGSGSSASIALELKQGGIRVKDAGINTDTPVFIHMVDTTPVTGNICGNGAFSATTVIDYPLINGNPGAILIVTPNYMTRTASVPPAAAVPAVYYDDDNHCLKGAGKWVITNLTAVPQPNNAHYNVLVVVP